MTGANAGRGASLPAFVLRRLLHLVPVLFLVSLGTFFLIDLVPGDPAVRALGAEASPERLAEAREEMGLNEPVVERYFAWLGDVVQGDLGQSLVNPSRSVSDLVLQTLPISVQLAVMGLVIALGVSIPLAIYTATREGRRSDRATLVITSGLISVPTFLAGLLLAFVFVFHADETRTAILVGGLVAAAYVVVEPLLPRRALPSALASRGAVSAEEARPLPARLALAGGIAVGAVAVYALFPELPRTGFERITGRGGLGENLRSAILPALALALTEIAVFTRVLRADLLATLNEDFVLAARAKGISTTRVLWRHALRPSSFSLVTLAGVSLGRLIGGTVVVETVFGIQGMGRLIVNDGVVPGDFRIVQGGVLVIAVGYVVVNLLVDLSYRALDPRVRHA